MTKNVQYVLGKWHTKQYNAIYMYRYVSVSGNCPFSEYPNAVLNLILNVSARERNIISRERISISRERLFPGNEIFVDSVVFQGNELKFRSNETVFRWNKIFRGNKLAFLNIFSSNVSFPYTNKNQFAI